MNCNAGIVVSETGVETVASGNYEKLADDITRWLEEYQRIQPLIEQLCNRCPTD
jgi:hypothetical protein